MRFMLNTSQPIGQNTPSLPPSQLKTLPPNHYVFSSTDELGNWLTYTFSREGPGVARELSENRDQIPEVGVRSRTSSSR